MIGWPSYQVSRVENGRIPLRILGAVALVLLLMIGTARASEWPDGGGPGRPVQAHSHNDYAQRHPLDDALARGFTSIEVDVFRSASRFLVGHRAADLRPERSLEGGYLDKLRARYEGRDRHEHDARDLTLILDVKSGLPEGLTALDELLGNYEGLLAGREGSRRAGGAVTVLVSRGGIAREVDRLHLLFLAVEGRLSDLGSGIDPAVMPQIAVDWRKSIAWKGRSPIPYTARSRLAALVRRAHEDGRRLRFWNTPDNPTVWRVLIEAGVDVIGTDDLETLEAFLDSRGR